MKRYVVSGIHPVLGREPGEVFAAELPDAQEKALVAGGALKHADGARQPDRQPDAPAGRYPQRRRATRKGAR